MPFWAWNARLDPRELVRQVGEMKKGGMGGFFMHVRYGLETEYLSPEFLECIRATVAEAKKRGMEAWLYDEDRWPSGFGAGKVTRNPEFRIKAFEWTAVPAESYEETTPPPLRCFSVRMENGSIAEAKALQAGEKPEPGRTVLVYRIINESGVRWFNHTNYVDAMNPDAIKAFIDSTYEVYKREFGAEFGRTIPGIFTDEPNYGSFYRADKSRCYPWTTRLPAEFEKRKGYNLLDRLYEISHRVNGAAASAVRRDYRQVIAELYTEAFSRQIGEWCARNRLEFTGHELGEESLQGQTDQVGACMPHYEWFQRPGIDFLTSRAPEILTAKQCVSVASQLGRNRVLSELYGCTGWDATFETYKHIGDWHQALGINHFCPHLSWYSMAGGAKRDYPASIFYQSPWWADHPLLAGYFGRLSLALSQGTALREIAVIHPIESAWMIHRKDTAWRTNGLTESLEHLCRTLLDKQLDFDFADESLLDKHGSVEGGATAPRLKIGRMSYRAVLVPESLTLRSTTLALLERFAAAGGLAIFCGTPPTRIDGQVSGRLAQFIARCEQLPPMAAADTLDAAGCALVRIRRVYGSIWHVSQPKVWVHCRQTPEGQVLFACNRDPAQGGPMEIQWRGSGRVRRIDLMTGALSDVPGVTDREGRQVFRVEMPPGGSALFVRTAEPAIVQPEPASIREVSRIPLAPSWAYELDEPNALNLDRARMRVAGVDRDWRPSKLLWQHEADLRKELDFPDNRYPQEQPYIWMRHLSPKSAAVDLEFDIDVEQAPSGPLTLALEHAARFRIAVNGKPVASKAEGWFIDRSIEKVPLSGVRLKKGRNVLRLSTEYRQHHWLEDVYLLGRFGVRVTGEHAAVTALPRQLAVGDWVSQGLAMYSGAVTYRQTVRVGRLAKGQRLQLRIENPKATVVRVAVNGRKLGALGWMPWVMDITRAIEPGAANRIEVTLVSSRRNLLGPLHHAQKSPEWTGPKEFRPDDAMLSPAYQLVPYGLLGETCLVVEEG